jgi:hypothetical protein
MELSVVELCGWPPSRPRDLTTRELQDLSSHGILSARIASSFDLETAGAGAWVRRLELVAHFRDALLGIEELCSFRPLLRVFGSVAAGMDSVRSDLDLGCVLRDFFENGGADWPVEGYLCAQHTNNEQELK